MKKINWQTFEDPAYFPVVESDEAFEGWDDKLDEVDEQYMGLKELV